MSIPSVHSGHRHIHGPTEAEQRTVQLELDVLAKNNHLAEHNRAFLTERGMVALNLMSSPGSGKTTLLERTLTELRGARPMAVLEGDQETVFDAERIQATGSSVLQINTGSGCHLDAAMVSAALRRLDPPNATLLFIENVGNLICPALFNLGEHAKVVIMSVPEGADKPRKYPHMFRAATVVLLNKIDLLPHVEFDVATFTNHLRNVNPTARILSISATRGDGLPDWYAWLRGQTATPPAPD